MNNPIIINIGRQLGSGGHDIGRMLAQDFGAQYYDREILNIAAKESGFSEEFFEKNDERKGFLRTFLHLPYTNNTASESFYLNNFSQESLFKFQSDAIRKEAAKSSCVFVGRCADYVLRDFPNTVNVFITASMQFRVEHIAKKMGVSPDEARKVIEQGEKQRAEYYNYYTGKRWGAAQSYDLCIDASILGIEQTEQFIAEFVRKKFGL
ncbi:MAG: cytidylate kinase-like family protein [Prevotella sp.]|jgi:cytidylate kinase|nr:cytidylate kinase-like family protein [Prevotella sp.]